MKLLFGTALVMFLILGPSTVASAQLTDSARATIDQLLNTTWGGGVDEQRAGESAYRNWQTTTASSNAYVDWAYVLNRVEYDKYREAARVAESLPELLPDSLDARYAQIWLTLMTGEVNRALLQMQELKTLLLASSPDEVTRFKFYSRLGRLYAYAEGPGQKSSRDTTLQDTLSVITDGLDDVDFGQFQNQRQQVTQQYASLLNEKASNVALLEQEQQAETDSKRQQIAMDNQEMSARHAELSAEVNAISDQVNAEVSKLRQAAAPVEAELRRLDQEIALLRSTISRIATDVAILENDAFYAEDPYWKARLLDRAARARSDLFRYQSDLGVLESQYASVLAELDALNGRAASVQAAANDQIALRESEVDEMRRQLRRNDRELNRLDRPRARTGYEHNMNSRTNHLPTYDPFPTDELRQQLLKILG
ncbi:MAG: hypothetical protein ACR2NP_14045 [Pirellulaceae bacterium]